MNLRGCCVVLVGILLVYAPARAQESAVEFWPEVDTWWRLTQAWRLSLFVPISKNLDTH